MNPADDLAARRPVWQALAQLYLDSDIESALPGIADRVIALDAGHVCQNLYLAVQAVGCGTCAVAAFNQKVLDDVLGVDGEDEFALYLAPVGKV